MKLHKNMELFAMEFSCHENTPNLYPSFENLSLHLINMINNNYIVLNL